MKCKRGYIFARIEFLNLNELQNHLEYFKKIHVSRPGFPGGSDGKESACNVGPGLIPGWEDPLEKEMATHSSILTWRIPWIEEPGGLESMGSQRVGHG